MRALEAGERRRDASERRALRLHVADEDVRTDRADDELLRRAQPRVERHVGIFRNRQDDRMDLQRAVRVRKAHRKLRAALHARERRVAGGGLLRDGHQRAKPPEDPVRAFRRLAREREASVRAVVGQDADDGLRRLRDFDELDRAEVRLAKNPALAAALCEPRGKREGYSAVLGEGGLDGRRGLADGQRRGLGRPALSRPGVRPVAAEEVRHSDKLPHDVVYLVFAV